MVLVLVVVIYKRGDMRGDLEGKLDKLEHHLWQV